MVKLQMSNELRQAMRCLFDVPPHAYAFIEGGADYPDIWGVALLYPYLDGTLFLAEIQGLPQCSDPCAPATYGFHIHEGNSCHSDTEEPFSQTGAHWNPGHCPHPSHAGDLPPLFGSCGYALSLFYTRGFMPEEAVGLTLVVHAMRDDFTSQPAGASGEKIACGEILANEDANENL